MTGIVLLIAIGIVLLAFEVIVPGGVLGVLGVLAMAGGCTLAFFELGARGGWIATGASIAALSIALYVEFVLLPKTRLGKRLFLGNAIDGASQPLPARAEDVVGKTGEAVTMMSPTGYVSIEGRRYEATSRSGLISKGSAVRVVAADNFRLIVTT